MLSQQEVLKALESLSLADRLAVIETALQDITDMEKARRRAKRAAMKKGLAAAAQKAAKYYESDPELTAFTALDGEDFYGFEEE